MSNKEKWAPWPDPLLADAYQVSNRGRVKSVERIITDANGHERVYRERILSLSERRQARMSVGGTHYSRSVPVAVVRAFGQLPTKWA